ncbi:MAG: hypothetical protein ACK5U7_05760, partial [Bacteroidota bacterium]
FMDDFYFFRQPFDFYYYYLIYLVFILYVIFNKQTIRLVPKWFLNFMLILYVTSFMANVAYGTLGIHLLKQVLGITYSAIAYYLLLKTNDFKIEKLFNIYMKIAFYVALWGLITEVLLLRGIPITSKIKMTSNGFYRIYSIMGEPYFLAVALIPALYFQTYCFLNEKKHRASFRNWIHLGVIGICYLFTFSSAGFIGLALIIVIYMWSADYLSILRGQAKILIVPVILISSIFFYNNLKDALSEFQVRVDDTFKLFQGGGEPDIKAISEVNASTFALYTNYIIAKESFVRNPFLGSGLGSHPVNYDITFAKYFPADFIDRFGTFNKFDANSLFLRLMSETGLFGLGAILIFMWRFFMGKKHIRNPKLRYLNIINQSIFILIVVRLVRTGHYFGNGFFLFIFMYYYTKKIADGKFRVPWLEYREAKPQEVTAVKTPAPEAPPA